MTHRYLMSSLFFLLISLVACACAQTGKEMSGQIGEFAIGSSPKDLGALLTTDCVGSVIDLSDCSGIGADGVRYTFFDGALSRVSANRGEVEGVVELPGDMVFGENVVTAAAKLKELGVTLDRDEVNGRIAYSSDFVLKSSVGIDYSIELHSDDHGALVEVVERTDF